MNRDAHNHEDVGLSGPLSARRFATHGWIARGGGVTAPTIFEIGEGGPFQSVCAWAGCSQKDDLQSVDPGSGQHLHPVQGRRHAHQFSRLSYAAFAGRAQCWEMIGIRSRSPLTEQGEPGSRDSIAAVSPPSSGMAVNCGRATARPLLSSRNSLVTPASDGVERSGIPQISRGGSTHRLHHEQRRRQYEIHDGTTGGFGRRPSGLAVLDGGELGSKTVGCLSLCPDLVDDTDQQAQRTMTIILSRSLRKQSEPSFGRSLGNRMNGRPIQSSRVGVESRNTPEWSVGLPIVADGPPSLRMSTVFLGSAVGASVGKRTAGVAAGTRDSIRRRPCWVLICNGEIGLSVTLGCGAADVLRSAA